MAHLKAFGSETPWANRSGTLFGARLETPGPFRMRPINFSQHAVSPGLLNRLSTPIRAFLVWKRSPNPEIIYLKTGDPNHKFAFIALLRGVAPPGPYPWGSGDDAGLRGGFADRAASTPGGFPRSGGGGTNTPRSHWKRGRVYFSGPGLDAPLVPLGCAPWPQPPSPKLPGGDLSPTRLPWRCGPPLRQRPPQ
ncbi:MAG: hypothetical protein CM15mP103_00900 [Gammaproteobacteria bacterium]|nr:MAG: hypothetical protein CM15mP103_00900 [Gammaproteobacteria bacterium]